MTWERTYGSYRTVTRRAIVEAEGNLMEQIALSMGDDMRRLLHDEAGWSAAELGTRWAPKVDLMVTDSHADYFAKNMIAVVAETRALQLLNPDPLPDLRPFRWPRRR